MKGLATRGRACGIVGGRWPYGANVDMESRERLVGWAETLGLVLARPSHKCLTWVREGRCRARICGLHGGPWDHISCWKYDGKPALLLAQPYGVDGSDIPELAPLIADPHISISIVGDNWYGHGTVGVEVWNRSVRRQVSERIHQFNASRTPKK